jgi:hypothetical protein
VREQQGEFSWSSRSAALSRLIVASFLCPSILVTLQVLKRGTPLLSHRRRLPPLPDLLRALVRPTFRAGTLFVFLLLINHFLFFFVT